MAWYRERFGAAYDLYRNHRLRVLSFARRILVREAGFSFAPVPLAIPLRKIALAYPYMGLFTDLTLRLGPERRESSS